MSPDPEIKRLSVEPRAASTIETMRAVGYSPETALADLIDNSITAGARQVDVQFQWNGRDSVIMVRDNGTGMSGTELQEAMRLGSGDPRACRPSGDLGRFGMGLKTASFSQSRKLTVVSRREGYVPVYWCWDLDHVSRTNCWELLGTSGPPGTLDSLLEDTGTVVVWEDLDRLVGNSRAESDDDRDRFWRLARGVRDHLAMVFHRYIESGRLRLSVNGQPVEPWNPFMPGAPGSQVIADETLMDGRVRVKAYVLPHASFLNREEKERWGGRRGWTAMQGFYVYRHERLLVDGSWLGLFRREEDARLARIMVDITNADDEAWQIDIKKSSARPPAGLRDDLSRLGRAARRASSQVYRHRGVRISSNSTSQPVVPLWDEMIRRGHRFYHINRAHPAVASLLDGAGALRERLEVVLRMIEESVPATRIFADMSSDPDQQGTPLEGEGERQILEMIRPIYRALLERHGPINAARELRIMQPFTEYPALIEQVIQEIP